MEKNCENCAYSDHTTETCGYWGSEYLNKKTCSQWMAAEFVEDGMKNAGNISIRREDVEKFLIATQYLVNPFKLGQKMRVIIDYDPQNPSVHFKYFKEEAAPDQPRTKMVYRDGKPQIVTE